MDRSDGSKRLSGGSWGGINLSLLSEVSHEVSTVMADSSVGEDNADTALDNSKMSASAHRALAPVTEEERSGELFSMGAPSTEFQDEIEDV